jgi:hypothetical protein
MMTPVHRQTSRDPFRVPGHAAAWPIQGLIRHFRPESERRIVARNGGAAGVMAEAAE